MSRQNVTTTLKIQIRAECAAVRGVRNRIGDFAAQCGLDVDEVEQVGLAVNEALANVIEHGYGGACEKPIEIVAAAVNRGGRSGLSIRIRDQADRVNPENIHGRALHDVKPGGLGVHIIRSVMDEVTYATTPEGECGMILTMVKLGKP